MTLGYTGLLFVLCALPDAGETAHRTGYSLALVPPVVQNLSHIPAYGLLALLWTLTLRAYGVAERRSPIVALVLASGFSGITELYQAWVPGRFPSMSDFMLNVVGIILALLLYRWGRFQQAFDLVTERFHAQRSHH